ncbi:MAG: ATP-dependent DNA helicase [Pseudomonadales bacterium]|nr:ATP-dependent DNA helicase [Pseudomonadales bacterium]MBO6595345.1 ATP-dependent DNA helicase [Pseudomonadales bacterium]MBO6821096.1 ATP-dependent DNA helicase [Pseudomonadales bacterium]
MSNTYNVSVGDLTTLCRGGDINFRFSSRSSAMEGIRGHQQVQRSRGEHYVPEYPVALSVIEDGREMTISGRLDGIGYDKVRQLFVIDEIKTLRIAVSEIPGSIMDSYWHQVLLYAYMLLQELNTETRIVVRLCFFHLDESSEETIERLVTRENVTQLFADTVHYYFNYLDRREAWLDARSKSLAGLSFPYGEFRKGQRDLSVAVFRALDDGGHLVLEAPTGLGKTMGTMYPAVRRLERQEVKRVMYLSAKTQTQQQAKAAVADLRGRGAALRSVVLTARDKVCFSPGEPCHPDHCQYAKGYYDKLPIAIDDILASDRDFTRERVEQLALQHELCPFELGLDLASQCDVIVADYNYVFDPVVYLRRFFEQGVKDSIVLIDEAHNLVDRGRQMFSAELDKEDFLGIARLMSESSPAVARAAKSVNRSILNYCKPNKLRFDELGHLTDSELPLGIIRSLTRFVEVAEEELRMERSDLGGRRETLLGVYFDALRFLRTSEWFDDTYIFLIHRVARKQRLHLYCVDPSIRLAEVFDRLAASVSFSATLRPSGFFREMMGIPESSKWYRLPSPFPEERLHVSVATFVDTSYRGRESSADELCTLIHDVISGKPGNYLIFFPSYQYLETIQDRFEQKYPAIPLLVQARNMSDEERCDFLSRFDDASETCGFAVMGGAFSEGIDLKGDRLIGVVVVGVGLPQVGIERDLIRDHFPGHGFEFAYQYPGMTRVLQTAGRLIRDAKDKGVLCLVDRRYEEDRYLDLLPAYWMPSICRNSGDVRENLFRFWREMSQT